MVKQRYSKFERSKATWWSIGFTGAILGFMWVGYQIKEQTDLYKAEKKVRSLTLEQQIELLKDQKYFLWEKKRLLELKMERHFREVEERRLADARALREAEKERMKWEAARMRYGARMHGDAEQEKMLKRQHDEMMERFKQEEEEERRAVKSLEGDVARRVKDKMDEARRVYDEAKAAAAAAVVEGKGPGEGSKAI